MANTFSLMQKFENRPGYSACGGRHVASVIASDKRIRRPRINARPPSKIFGSQTKISYNVGNTVCTVPAEALASSAVATAVLS